MKGVTLYSGLSKFYFQHLLRQLIKVGGLARPGIIILDFGCGRGELKRLLAGSNVIGYDIIPELSDVTDWRTVEFDVLVANEVFYSFSEADLEGLLLEMKQKNPKLELVVGISRQGLLNNIGKYLLGRPDAHSATRLAPKNEVRIFEKYCEVVALSTFMTLVDVYLWRFK